MLGATRTQDRRDIEVAFRSALGRAQVLAANSCRLRTQSGALRGEAQRLRQRPRASRVGFRLEGEVELGQVSAEWTPEGLVASAALRQRADLIVGMGDVFTDESGGQVVASLGEGPTVALLTLMRACDRVGSISVFVSPSRPRAERLGVGEASPG